MAFGALSLLMVAFTILGFVISNMPMPMSQMISSVVTYILAGAVLVTLGVGSIMARRWARDLSLIVAWAWLLLGIGTTAMMIFLVPRMTPVGSPAFVITCMAVVMGLFGILVPLALVLFYRSPHVRATCIALDPVPRWTERVPLPLLGLCLWTAITGFVMLSTSVHAVMPLGAQIITGAVAVLVYVALAAICFYIAWGLYQRSIVAWWVAIAYAALTAIWGAASFPLMDYNKLIAAMHMPKTAAGPQIAAVFSSPLFIGYIAVFWVAYIVYLVYVRRFLVLPYTHS